MKPNHELEELLRRFMEDTFTSERISKLADEKELCSAHKAMLEDLSALSLNEYFGELECGESGWIPDLALLAYEASRCLCPLPVVETVLFGPVLNRFYSKLLSKSGKNAISKIAEDNSTLSLILVNQCKTFNVKKGGKGDLDIASLPHPNLCEYLLILDPEDSSLYLLSTSQEQFKTSKVSGIELICEYGDLQAKDLEVIKLFDSKTPDLSSWISCLYAAQLSGVADKVIEMTCDYVSTRKQYGVPVGGFQALQHGLAGMHVKSEALRSCWRLAAWMGSEEDDQFKFLAACALRYSFKYAQEIVEQAIQFHGGIGFTWEYVLHNYLRRVMAIKAQFQCLQQDSATLLASIALDG